VNATQLLSRPESLILGDPGSELRHEAAAALLGIEAAALGLTRHRQLPAAQLDELSNGLLAEVRRLRAMLDQRVAARTTFDLCEAIAPVLTCARARGLIVRSTVEPGVRVLGRPDTTAQVLVALLTNADRHAPGSPIDVRAFGPGPVVTLVVEDRGPGAPDVQRERVFERSVQLVEGRGSGLGLFIARRLMEEQHGTIAVESRPGGGTSVLLRFGDRAIELMSEADSPVPSPEPMLVGA